MTLVCFSLMDVCCFSSFLSLFLTFPSHRFLVMYAKTLFDLKEYRRSAHVLEKDHRNNQGRFLRGYALFMVGVVLDFSFLRFVFGQLLMFFFCSFFFVFLLLFLLLSSVVSLVSPSYLYLLTLLPRYRLEKKRKKRSKCRPMTWAAWSRWKE